MNLSIIIPVFNEINFLQKILGNLFRYTTKIKKEIIIVDDCSNDGTKEWLETLLNKKINYGLLENLTEDIMYPLSHTKFMLKTKKEDFKFHLKDVLLEMDG